LQNLVHSPRAFAYAKKRLFPFCWLDSRTKNNEKAMGKNVMFLMEIQLIEFLNAFISAISRGKKETSRLWGKM